MAGKDRSKHGPTPKRLRKTYRPVTLNTLAAFNRGLRDVPSRRCLDPNALRDAIGDCGIEELRAIIDCKDVETLKIWTDIFAGRYPDDKRWDAWRNYRKHEASYAN